MAWQMEVEHHIHLRCRAVQEHRDHLRHAERRGRPEERVPEALGRQGLHGAEDDGVEAEARDGSLAGLGVGHLTGLFGRRDKTGR